MKKKTSWIKVLAIFTAIIGAAVAVAGYLKKKSKKLSDELDFDNSMYFDDTDYRNDDDQAAEETDETDGEEENLDLSLDDEEEPDEK